MSDTSTIARPYAQALFDIAKGEEALAEWANALGALAEIVTNGEASAFLSRPDLDVQVRADFIGSVGAETGAAELVGSSRGQNLLRLLVENDRLTALPDIVDRFNTLKAEAENTVKVTLVTATDADADVAERISVGLEKKFGRKVELELEIDDELLGGAVVRAEDMVIDGSVKTRLRQLAESLIS
ncbi:MAG TPA: F0F1 ATP synthase subunit delta [Gammaproteobacteria bacterium]|nr:F0F1 ATP synthase subunit delta [Gammaproteobacteria bacterium]